MRQHLETAGLLRFVGEKESKSIVPANDPIPVKDEKDGEDGEDSTGEEKTKRQQARSIHYGRLLSNTCNESISPNLPLPNSPHFSANQTSP